jgi:hypothetical protein
LQLLQIPVHKILYIRNKDLGTCGGSLTGLSLQSFFVSQKKAFRLHPLRKFMVILKCKLRFEIETAQGMQAKSLCTKRLRSKELVGPPAGGRVQIVKRLNFKIQRKTVISLIKVEILAKNKVLCLN